MKNLLFIVLCMSCLCSCSQSHDLAGEYEKISKNGSVEYLLKLHPDGTFQFYSYSIRQIEGNSLQINSNFPVESGISGRGKWSADNDVIYFRTDRDTDMDHNYTLDFKDTKAKFKNESPEISSNEKAVARLEFFESGIFWMNGIEMEKRN